MSLTDRPFVWPCLCTIFFKMAFMAEYIYVFGIQVIMRCLAEVIHHFKIVSMHSELMKLLKSSHSFWMYQLKLLYRYTQASHNKCNLKE